MPKYRFVASYGNVSISPSDGDTTDDENYNYRISCCGEDSGKMGFTVSDGLFECRIGNISDRMDGTFCKGLSVILSSVAYRRTQSDRLVIGGDCPEGIASNLSDNGEGILRCNDPDEELFVEYYDADELDFLTVEPYSPSQKDAWDAFIDGSVNGTFLQSMAFLGYHPEDRFNNCHLMVRRKNALVAVVPGCEMAIDGRRTFFSYRGSTYGGIIVGKDHYNVQDLKTIIFKVEEHLLSKGFRSIVLKPTSDLFCDEPNGLNDYLLHKRGYSDYQELSFYIDCTRLQKDVIESFTKHKRKHYKESQRNGLEFREFSDDSGILAFHDMLTKNLSMHGRKPTHSYEELLDLYHNRIGDRIRFYGVYLGERMISGTMLFIFSKDVIHTQYIATDYDYNDTQSTYFLYGKLIERIRDDGYRTLSFGISTESEGRYLNEGLASLKEGFGSFYSINRTYTKNWL